jgi:hypothetical protein
MPPNAGFGSDSAEEDEEGDLKKLEESTSSQLQQIIVICDQAMNKTVPLPSLYAKVLALINNTVADGQATIPEMQSIFSKAAPIEANATDVLQKSLDKLATEGKKLEDALEPTVQLFHGISDAAKRCLKAGKEMAVIADRVEGNRNETEAATPINESAEDEEEYAEPVLNTSTPVPEDLQEQQTKADEFMDLLEKMSGAVDIRKAAAKALQAGKEMAKAADKVEEGAEVDSEVDEKTKSEELKTAALLKDIIQKADGPKAKTKAGVAELQKLIKQAVEAGKQMLPILQQSLLPSEATSGSQSIEGESFGDFLGDNASNVSNGSFNLSAVPANEDVLSGTAAHYLSRS